MQKQTQNSNFLSSGNELWHMRSQKLSKYCQVSTLKSKSVSLIWWFSFEYGEYIKSVKYLFWNIFSDTERNVSLQNNLPV